MRYKPVILHFLEGQLLIFLVSVFFNGVVVRCGENIWADEQKENQLDMLTGCIMGINGNPIIHLAQIRCPVLEINLNEIAEFIHFRM